MIAKPRGRRKSLSSGVFLRGSGTFKTPSGFEWHRIPKSGARIPVGSLVRVPRRKSAVLGGRTLKSNTLSTANRKRR